MFVTSTCGGDIWGGCGRCGRKGVSREWLPAMDGRPMESMEMRLDVLMEKYRGNLIRDGLDSDMMNSLVSLGSGLRDVDSRCPCLGLAYRRDLSVDMIWAFGKDELAFPYYLSPRMPEKFLCIPLGGHYGSMMGFLFIATKNRMLGLTKKILNYRRYYAGWLSTYTPDTLYLPSGLTQAAQFNLKSLEFHGGLRMADSMYITSPFPKMVRMCRPRRVVVLGLTPRLGEFLFVNRRNFDEALVVNTGSKVLDRTMDFDRLFRAPETMSIPLTARDLRRFDPQREDVPYLNLDSPGLY